MPSCSVPGCRSGYKNEPETRRRYFGLPKDPERLKQWNKNIPLKSGSLAPTSKICDIHFEESVIKKVDRFIIKGETVELPKGVWRLMPDAVPTIFPKYMNKKLPKKRVLPQKRYLQPETIVPDLSVSCQEDTTTTPEATCQTINNDPLQTYKYTTVVVKTADLMQPVAQTSKDILPEEIELCLQSSELCFERVKLPGPQWAIHQCRNVTVICEIANSKGIFYPKVTKSLEITDNGKVSIFARDRDVTPRMLDNSSTAVLTEQDLEGLIKKLHEMFLCTGSGYTSANITYCKTGLLMDECWFSKSCQILLTQKTRKCAYCLRLRSSIAHQITRRGITKKQCLPPETELARAKLQINDLKSQLGRYKQTNKKKMETILRLRKIVKMIDSYDDTREFLLLGNDGELSGESEARPVMEDLEDSNSAL